MHRIIIRRHLKPVSSAYLGQHTVNARIRVHQHPVPVRHPGVEGDTQNMRAAAFSRFGHHEVKPVAWGVLLAYCRLDTLAMVKVLGKLQELAGH